MYLKFLNSINLRASYCPEVDGEFDWGFHCLLQSKNNAKEVTIHLQTTVRERWMLLNKSGGQNTPKEFTRDFANFISIFVAPPTVAIIATICFSLWSPIGLGSLSAPFTILVCFLCFALFPFLAILYFKHKKVVDIYVSERTSRTPFFLIAIASYSAASIIFALTETRIMFLLALGSLFVSIIAMGINMFWKVSIHTAGVTGPIFALVYVFGVGALPLATIVGLVGWSRIKLKNHTFGQTLAGTLLSLSVGIVLFTTLYY